MVTRTIMHMLCMELIARCPAGTYFSSSNSSCSTCPANSVSEEEGLTQCTCIEGYYRAAQGEDLPCERKLGHTKLISLFTR